MAERPESEEVWDAEEADLGRVMRGVSWFPSSLDFPMLMISKLSSYIRIDRSPGTYIGGVKRRSGGYGDNDRYRKSCLSMKRGRRPFHVKEPLTSTQKIHPDSFEGERWRFLSKS